MPSVGDDLGRPIGVVFDTNLWRQGSLDIEKLKQHGGRLQKLGIEVWIPTQVFLEWVDHGRRDAEAHASLGKRPAASGMHPELPRVERDASIIEKQMVLVLGAISNVRILPMDGKSAVDGIVDQILGRGAGSTKAGVKTGSVDSSLIRDGLLAAHDDPTKVVFVTDNVKDFRKASERMGVPLRVTNEYKLYSEALQFQGLVTTSSVEVHVNALPTTEDVTSIIRDYMESER